MCRVRKTAKTIISDQDVTALLADPHQLHFFCEFELEVSRIIKFFSYVCSGKGTSSDSPHDISPRLCDSEA